MCRWICIAVIWVSIISQPGFGCGHRMALRAIGIGPQSTVDSNKVRSEMILATKQKLATCHVEAALLYQDIGEIEEATKEIDVAMKLNPGLAVHYYYLAQIFEKNGNNEGRRRALENALSIDPSNPSGRFQFADTLFRSGDSLGAIRELEHCLKLLSSFAKSKARTKYYYDPQGNAYSIEGLDKKVREMIMQVKLSPKAAN